jgi:phosphoribosylaminoimidazolecarboxamide formyltransferase / IMP cyclohydrolase
MSIRPVKEIDDLVSVENVFCSVTNKEGLVPLIQGMIDVVPKMKIFSTGGTYSYLKNELGARRAPVNLVEVSNYTGMPETKGGLVKSLHHKLFLGYLTENYCVDHWEDLKRESAVPIDLVIVNLYDFKKAVAAASTEDPVSLEMTRGNIDVGGPSALRAAAKNFLRVMVLPKVEDYNEFIGAFEEYGGATDFHMRYFAAKKTFRVLWNYDRAIEDFLDSVPSDKMLEAYQVHNSRI